VVRLRVSFSGGVLLVPRAREVAFWEMKAEAALAGRARALAVYPHQFP